MALLPALAGLFVAGDLANAEPILDFTGGSPAFVAITSGTFGWTFRVESPASIGALGVFDIGADGLASDHAIGLWSSGGALLRAVVISNADSVAVASTSSGGDWRFTAVPKLTLSPGDYVIGATYAGAGSDDLFEEADASLIPGVDFGAARVSEGSGLIFPSTDEPGIQHGYFGPNLLAVPEPSSLILLGAGMIGIAGRVRRGRRSAA